MQLSTNGLDKLKTLEGLKLVPYRDSGGRLTVGYGHLIRLLDAITPSTTIDEDRATSLLVEDVSYTEMSVGKIVTSTVNQNQFDAMVLFAYNVGVNNFASSTLLKMVNLSQFDTAADEFMRWDKIHTSNGMYVEVAGLVNRRQAEKDLFMTSSES